VPSSTTSAETTGDDFGARLRHSRRLRGLSLQQLALLADVSASFISQIENGKSQPSVATLVALATSLGVPVDDLVAGRSQMDAAPAHGGATGAHTLPSARPWKPSEYSNTVSVIHPSHRVRREPLVGVIWERLASTPDRGVNFKRIIYAPGATSAPGGELVSHAGHEYGFGISGEIEVTVGDLVTILGPGDSIDFASASPHALRNLGAVDFVGIWIDHYPFH
jgi:transcriptional regulator with XRE-family HTH domain/quercetin dioxygenase-like cupin family protein